MKTRKNRNLVILILISVLLSLMGAVYFCTHNIVNSLREEMQGTLEAVAEYNNVSVCQEITSKFQVLHSISVEMGCEPEQVEAMLGYAKGFVENYGFKRIGYAYPIGVAYTTEGFIQDMSYLDFFKDSMKGKTVITDTQKDIAVREGENVNWLSVPVYDNNEKSNEIKGVLFATYYSDWFEEILDTQSFDGEGYSCIIGKDGGIVAHSTSSPIGEADNFFEYLGKNADGVDAEELQYKLGKEGSGEGSFYLDGKQDYYYMPLDLQERELEWYIVTMVPEEVLAKRLEPIRNNMQWLLRILMLIVLGGLSVLLWNYLSKRKELMTLAYTDALTGGDNFAIFAKKLKEKKGTHGYLVAMDLSQFKIINNTCGIERGDQVLCAVWEMIVHCIGSDELAARIYADRFVIFLLGKNRTEIASRLEKLAKNIIQLASSLNIPKIRPVFGIYETWNQDAVEKNYGNAVQAKMSVKERRDFNYAFYERQDYEKYIENKEIEDSFEQAVIDKQFEVWYQPKYDATTGEIVGSEALVRWRRRDGSLLPPYKFIPLFEKNGMIAQLDKYMFRNVCEHQKQWEREGKRCFPISVNISRVSLYYYNLVEKYKIILEEYGLDPSLIQLEITESAMIDNNEIVRLLEQFHYAGFHMILDDFGSGYSSLASLNKIHFDTLKLDKSLVDFIGDEKGEKLLFHITRLAQSMQLHITAEGVETEEQVRFLQGIKCDEIQGYYFSRPLPKDEFEALLGK